MEKLIELDGQNFIYTLDEATNVNLLNKALNHPNKKLISDNLF